MHATFHLRSLQIDEKLDIEALLAGHHVDICKA